jgi:hypothetical protein
MLSLKTWETVTDYKIGEHPITFKVKRLGFTESKPFNVAFGKIRIDAPITARMKMGRATAALGERGIAIMAAALTAAGLAVPPRTDDIDADVAAHGKALADAGIPSPEIPAEQERELVNDVSLASREVEAADALLADSIDDAWVASCFAKFVKDVAGLEVDGVPITTGEQLHPIADRPLVLRVLREIRSFSHLGEAEKNGSPSPSPSAPGAREADGGLIAVPAESADSPRPATATETRPEPTSCSERVAEAVPV